MICSEVISKEKKHFFYKQIAYQQATYEKMENKNNDINITMNENYFDLYLMLIMIMRMLLV